MTIGSYGQLLCKAVAWLEAVWLAFPLGHDDRWCENHLSFLFDHHLPVTIYFHHPFQSRQGLC